MIINAISIWNTLHLTKAVEYQKQSGSFNEELLHHMSPLGWGTATISSFWSHLQN
nr:Tn3 family transposase [Bacillus pacificus]